MICLGVRLTRSGLVSAVLTGSKISLLGLGPYDTGKAGCAPSSAFFPADAGWWTVDGLLMDFFLGPYDTGEAGCTPSSSASFLQMQVDWLFQGFAAMTFSQWWTLPWNCVPGKTKEDTLLFHYSILFHPSGCHWVTTPFPIVRHLSFFLAEFLVPLDYMLFFSSDAPPIIKHKREHSTPDNDDFYLSGCRLFI